jgi:indole-3-glycerol phosphate synthase
VNLLDSIVHQKHQEIARLPTRRIQVSDLREALDRRGGRRDFAGALRGPGLGPVRLIAEVKKASPSAGVIRADFDPVQIAKDYERGGAACLSVLTDERFFQGSLRYLHAIRSAVKLPLLRKDFVIDARQVLEAIEWGADAILLIVAILSDEQLEGLHELAMGAGLDALVEVHDEVELERAQKVGARLIGVNNRDLRTFKVDLGTTERLAGRLRRFGGGGDVLLVAESGVHGHVDVQRLAACGARAVLVGEWLMREGDIAGKTRELLVGRGRQEG